MQAIELLRRELDQRGITQTEAARQLGVSKQVLGEWLTGQKRPDAVNLLVIEAWSERRVPVLSWLTKQEMARVSGSGRAR